LLVLQSYKKEMYGNSEKDFNWVKPGNILSISSTGGSFVSLEVGEAKCTTHAKVVELPISENELKAMLRVSIKQRFGPILDEKGLEECVLEDFNEIMDLTDDATEGTIYA